MKKPKNAYICPHCGYVLPKEDAVVSGWDAEHSQTHVHCPGCGKIIARYVEQERRKKLELDRIDKALLILPFMPLADMVSTLFSLTLGGQEVGIVAKPIYERYGKLGLVALLTFIFLVFFACVWLFIIDKRRVQMQASRRERVALAVGINFLFLVEGWWMAVVITNLILPPSFLVMLAIWFGVTIAYFVSVTFFTRTEMKRLIRE